MTYKQAVIHIYDWQYSNTGSFFNRLVTCISKADMRNRELLAKGFPEVVQAYEDWIEEPGVNDLFKRELSLENVRSRHKSWYGEP